jgi:hypothetical protein
MHATGVKPAHIAHQWHDPDGMVMAKSIIPRIGDGMAGV